VGHVNAMGSGNITFAGAGTVLDLNGKSPVTGLLVSSGNKGIVTNGSATAATLTLNGAGTQSFSGLIQNGLGVIGLTKAGVGTQILNGNVANTYTGATTINGGTLKLDFSNFATAANLVNAGSALVFADGTLSILGHATNATTQTFASLTANGGAASIILTPRGGVSTRLVITNNSINRTAGSTINFDTSAAAGASTATVAWNPGLTNGLIGGAYTVTDSAGTGFATVSGGNVVAMSGSTALAATSDSATTNFTTNPSSGYTGGVLTLSSSGTHATNSLTVVASANGALDLGGQNLTFASGGLLMTGASDFTITTGTLGASAKELIIHQFGLGTLTVGSQISGSTGSLTKDGSGLLVLSGSNSYTGLTTIDGGTIKISESNNLGTGAIVLNRGTLDVGTGGFDLGRAITAGGSGGTLQVDSGTLTESGLVTINSGLTVQGAGNTILTGTISGLGILTKAGAGTLTLQNSSVNTAGLVITSGTVMLGADATISNAAGVDISGNSTLDLAGYNFTLSSASATSVTFGAGTQLFNSGAALAKFNGITSGFTVNFTGGRIGGQEVWIGSNATNFTLNVMAGFGGGALYLGNTASASTINLNLSGTGTFNLGATLETRTVVGSQLKNALNLTIANTVSEFSGGAILSSSYATANPLGTRDIYTTADNSLTFASGTGTFLLSGGTIDVRSAANTAAAGIIVTNGNTLVIGGGNLLGNSLASTTGAIALQSGNLMLRNAGVSGVANFTISDAPGNDGRTIQMSGSTGTFTAATSINPGYFIIGSQADGGTWNRGTLNSGSNYSIVGDASGNSAFANVTSLFTISDNSGFSGLVMGSGSIPALLNLGVNSTFFALSSNAPSRTYNVGVGAGNNIATAATGGFVFGVNDSNVDSTQIINLNRDKGDGNVTLLTNGASLSNAINLNATQTGTGNLYIATRNLTLNAGVTFGGTGGIFTDLNPGNGQLESALGNGAGDFNGSGNVDVLFTINGIMNGLNTVYLNGDNPAAGSTLDSGITLGSTAVVGGTQTWTVHQGIADAVAFGNAQQTPGNWTNGSVSLTNSGNYGTFEAATNSSAPSLASNYRFNSIVLNPTAATGQYKLVNNVYNDGGTAKEGLFASSFAFSVSDNNAGRYTFSLNGQDLYVDRFSNFASANAPGLILMNDVANSTSSIRAVGTASDVLSIGSFYAINGSTLEIAGGSYNNMIAYRNGSALPGDTAAAPNSVSNLTTVGYDGANNLTPGANISFLGSGANSGTNAYTTAKGTGGTVRIVGGKMTSNSYILNPVGTVGLIDTTSVSGGDTTLNNVTIRASSAQSLSGIDIVGNTFTPTVAGVYSDGDVVRFTATTSLPGGLLANTIYYVRDTNLATGAFSVSLTPGGAAVALSSPGVGTITVQDWSGASDATQHSALVVGGTTTINGNLVFANAPGAVNQSTLRVGAVNPQQATVYNPSIYTSATTSVLVAGAGYMVGTSDVIVSFTTGNGQAGTVSGKATANASGQITALTINVGTATIPIDLLTTFGTITSGGVTSGTAGVLKSLTGDQGNPLVYVANAGQTNSTAVLNVTGDLSVGSTNNLAIQSNATVRVGGNVDILGVGQNQVMLITGAGVGINAASTFTLNGNKGAAAPQTVNIVPTLGKFHVGDGNAGVLTGVAAQAKLTGNLTVAGTADINGASSSLNLNGKTMTLLGASPMTVGGTLSVGTVIRGALSGSVNVLNQGKVTGNGSISGQLTVQSGATIAPGDATTGKGTLTAGDLTLNDNVNISLAITKDASGVAGTDYGQLSVGALHLDGISQINLSLQNVFGDGSIFDSSATHLVWASVITSTDLTGFSSSQFNIDSSSLTGVLAGAGHFMMVQNASNHNVLDLEYMAIPEPQTWAMLLGGVGLLGVIQRARRRIQS